MMSRMLILALALYGAAAVPLFEERGSTLDDPDCVAGVPATADPDTVNKVYLAALGRNVDMRVMQATFETCLQESHCNNLKCGDQDSLGAFQQRPSMGWGTAAQVSDVTYAAGKFLDQAIPLAAANPGFTPDQIAQGVQHAELGNLYAQQLNWANQLISQAAAATGKAAPGGGSGGGSAPAPPPSSGGGGCGKHYTAVSGDWCSKIASANGISVAQFQQLNSNINGQCTNIQIGTAYCVAPGSAPAPASSGGGSCNRKYTAVSGDWCSKIASANGLSVAQFQQMNPNINGQCTNIQVGTAYCV